MQETHVAGTLAGLLQTYLDQENIHAPEISLQLANYSADVKIPTPVWWELLENIQKIKNQTALGLKIGRLGRPHHFGVMGYLIMHCQTLGEALLRFQRYQELIHDFSKVRVTIDKSSLIMKWDTELGKSTQLSDEVFLSCFISFIQHISSEDVKPKSLQFNHENSFSVSEYEAIIKCPVSFGHDQVALEMSLDDVNVAINSSDPDLLAIMDSKAQALKREDEFLMSLQELLSKSLSQGIPTLEKTAKQLKISARTLHRRLQERDLNFKKFLQQTREQLAKYYLSDANLSLNEISYLLGYSEQSSFARAFKIWFEMTPNEYRKMTSGQ